MPKVHKVIFIACTSIILCSLVCNRAQSLDIINDKIPLRVAVIIEESLPRRVIYHLGSTWWIGMYFEDMAKYYAKNKYDKYDMLSSMKPNNKYDIVLSIRLSDDHGGKFIIDVLNNQQSIILTVEEGIDSSKLGGLLYGSINSRNKFKKETTQKIFDNAIYKLHREIAFKEYVIGAYLRRTLPENIVSRLVFQNNNSIWLERINDYDAAVIWYEKAALDGSEAAEVNLKNMYPNGIDPSYKTDKIVRIFRKAKFKEMPEAQYELGNAYEKGNVVKKDVLEAIKWYRLSAQQGNQNAKNRVEYLELNSISINKYDADQGNILALKRLGDIYAEGRSVPRDDIEAMRWYRTAADKGENEAIKKVNELEMNSLSLNKAEAESGDAGAQRRLGDMYMDGRGVPKNEVEAVKWYRKSALQGNEDAKSKVVELEKVSLVLNQKEAEGGDAAALKRLGDMYAEGISVPRNTSEAMRLYQKSAELEYVKAYVAIGSIYWKGLGVQKNDIEAYKWYKKAQEKGDVEAVSEINNLENISPAINKRNAEQGDVNAMIHLADLYSEGTYIRKNDKEAKKYYKLAARKNEKDGDYDSAIDLYKKAGDQDGVRRVGRLLAKKEQEERRAAEQRARDDRKYLCNAARNYAKSLRYSLSEQISAGQSFTQAVMSYYGASGYYSIAERYGRNTVDYVLRTECR